MRALLISLVLSLGFVQAQFSDVPAEHWAQDSIRSLVDSGVLLGFPDGSYRGESSFTRYEAAVVLGRLEGVLKRSLKAELYAELSRLSEQLIGVSSETDGALLIMMVNESLDELEALSAKVARLERDAPTSVALFDDIRRNLVQLEQSFSTDRLATQENLLTELDLRLNDFKASLEADSINPLRERLSASEQGVEALRRESQRLEGDLARVDADATRAADDLRREIAALGEQLTEQGQSVSLLRVTGGFAGDGPRYALEGVFSTANAYIAGRIDPDVSLLGRYDVLPNLSLGGRYERTERGDLGSVQLGINALAPLIFETDVGYSTTTELGLRVRHEGLLSSAVIQGLDVGLAARFRFADETQRLLDAHARFALPVGPLVLTPGVLYRDVGDAYSGFVGELALRYAVSDDLALFGLGRYGLFTPSGGGETRDVPEAVVGLVTRGVTVTGFVESGLPAFERFPTFLGTDPLARQGLQFGVSISTEVTLR